MIDIEILMLNRCWIALAKLMTPDTDGSGIETMLKYSFPHDQPRVDIPFMTERSF